MKSEELNAGALFFVFDRENIRVFYERQRSLVRVQYGVKMQLAQTL